MSSQNDYTDPVGSAWPSWNSASRTDEEVGPYHFPVDHVPSHESSAFAPSWSTHDVSGQSMVHYVSNPAMQHQEYAPQTGVWIQRQTSNMNPFSMHNFHGSGPDPTANLNLFHPQSLALISFQEFSREELPVPMASQQPNYNRLSPDYSAIIPSQFHTEAPASNWELNGRHAPGSSFRQVRIEAAIDPAPRPQVPAVLSAAEIQHQYSGSMQCKLHVVSDLFGRPSRTVESIPIEALCNAELTTVGELLRHLKDVHDITGNHARVGDCCCAWPGCGRGLKESSYLRHVLTHCICWVCPVYACLKTAPRHEALLSHFEKCHPGLGLAGSSSSQYSYTVFKTAVGIERLSSDA